MEGGFQFLDIILFAMIAGFIVLRLRGVLGKRTGHEEHPSPERRPRPIGAGENANDARPPQDNVTALPERGGRKNAEEAYASAAARTAVKRVQEIDRNFDAELFVAGAKSAYEMIVTAFAKGDEAALKPLLSAEVLSNFSNEIKARAARGETQETTLVGFKSAKIVDAEIKGRIGEITVRFQAELIQATRNAEGNIIAGTPNAMEQVTEIWTFARDLRSRDPNWALIATSTPA